MNKVLRNTKHKTRLPAVAGTTRHAFTLVEITIVMAILAIFIISLFTVFRTSLDARKKSEVRLEIYQNARAILDMMSREIQTAIFDPAKGIHSEGYETGSGIKTGSQKDEFFFVGVVDNSGDMDMAEIGYWLDGQNRVMRHIDVANDASTPPLDFLFTSGSDDELGYNVTDLQFTFHYRSSSAGAWTETANANWDSSSNSITNYDAGGNLKNPDGLPSGVEVQLTVEDSTGQEEKTFSTIISLPEAR